MASLRTFSRSILSRNQFLRFISTSGGGKDNATASSPKEEQDEEEFDAVEHRRSKLPNADGIKEASKSWMGQLPHEEDPTVGYDLWKKTYAMDGTEYVAGQTTLGREWTARLFPKDLLIKLHTKKDWSMDGMRRVIQKYDLNKDIKSQHFTPERHGILGPDLATAHFICFRRGKVKFVGYENWWFDHKTLPRQYDPLYLIEKIDATDCKLFFEGIDNICNLHQMVELDLTNNTKLDVWAFDKLYRQYRYSSKLERILVRNCVKFCERSLAAAYRIPSLKEIVITNTAASSYQFLDLTLELLKDVKPDLKVII